MSRIPGRSEDEVTIPGADEETPVIDEDAVFRNVFAVVAGGVTGTTVMTLVLAMVNALYGNRLQVFAEVAKLSGGGENVLLGFVLFFGAGAVAWPMLFITLGVYLPGGTRPRQGVVFAMFLWVGYVVAFSGRYLGSATDLAVFLAFSVVSHAVYGFLVGFVWARLVGEYEAPEVEV